MAFFKPFFVFMAFFLMTGNLTQADTKKTNPMKFDSSGENCEQCHSNDEIIAFNDQFAQTCKQYCFSCHKNLDNHHIIEKKMKGALPKGLHFKEQNRITCRTCHDISIKRFASTSWKSESLFENLFKDKKIHKTYYLTVKNTNGELCKKCH